MAKTTVIDRLTRAVSVAVGAIGFRQSDVIASARGVSIPSAGINVILVEGRERGRVWSATEYFSILGADDFEERKTSRVLFEIPLGQEWRVGRSLAMKLAERRIDAAIDEAVS